MLCGHLMGWKRRISPRMEMFQYFWIQSQIKLIRKSFQIIRQVFSIFWIVHQLFLPQINFTQWLKIVDDFNFEDLKKTRTICGNFFQLRASLKARTTLQKICIHDSLFPTKNYERRNRKKNICIFINDDEINLV